MSKEFQEEQGSQGGELVLLLSSLEEAVRQGCSPAVLTEKEIQLSKAFARFQKEENFSPATLNALCEQYKRIQAVLSLAHAEARAEWEKISEVKKHVGFYRYLRNLAPRFSRYI